MYRTHRSAISTLALVAAMALGAAALRAPRHPHRQPQARGGEILVSSQGREIVEPREVPLKGLEGTHRLHPTSWSTAGAASLSPVGGC